MKHAMIDIETLRLKKPWRAPVLNIGVVLFDGDGRPQDELDLYIIQDTIPTYFEDEPDTVEWWASEKRDEPRSILEDRIDSRGIPIEEALDKLGRFLIGCEGIYFNHPTFDAIVLESYYNHFELDVPWSHKQVRDYATLRAQYPDVDLNWGVGHLGLDDAIYQVKVLEVICKAHCITLK